MTPKQARSMRKNKGLTARLVAKKMKISAPHLCDLESGRRNWTPKIISAWKRAMSV